ncbi:histidinol dehydrogenase [Bacteroidia bacterium]|nr:histidinol dehydrogenase [Bacteroidia bacterium]GHT50890.1 histidinol dehydrogenase [Bacteroidia bacterium]
MITLIENPARNTWEELSRRDVSNDETISARVTDIVNQVRLEGDIALLRLAKEIDGLEINSLQIPDETIDAVCRDKACLVSTELRNAIENAAKNIRLFHEAQRSAGVDMETQPGVRCLQRSIPIQKVGLYIPGGTAPLFSTVLMLAIPAQVAGCKEIILCTPPAKNGSVAPEILFAASVCGVKKIVATGGAQAIAAMAYGTQTIPRVDKIFGPGNRYVTKAKQLVAMSQVAIDMPAGPSEVMVLADSSAKAGFVAADMLSQAEHGSDSQSIVVVNSQELAAQIENQLNEQVEKLPRKAFAIKALENSKIILLNERQEMIDFANTYAAEHLIISMQDPWEVAEHITAAGSIFIGNYSPESAGDYASGTNHTLPTSGWAKAYSGVNLDSFMKKITYQELTRQGLESLSDTIITMAEAEGLDAHAQAVKVRLNT